MDRYIVYNYMHILIMYKEVCILGETLFVYIYTSYAHTHTHTHTYTHTHCRQ